MIKFDFEIPSYCLEELKQYNDKIPISQVDNLIMIVNLTKMNNRINELQAKKIKKYIKQKASIKLA